MASAEVQHTDPPNPEPPKKANGWKTFGITVIVLVAIALCFWLAKAYFFPNEFKPVSLSTKETSELNRKLDQLNMPRLNNSESSYGASSTGSNLEPEPYSETGASREVAFSEREINAMIAHNTDLGDKLVIDLSDNLASVKLLLPLDPNMPVVGGKTLHISAGVELAYENGRPIVRLKGISAWGVPLPNAWLNDMKNVDLVHQFGDSSGFWQSFADGIEFMRVSDGKLVVKLNE